MAAAGLAVASVDYRLSGEARFPAQQHDVAAAFAWLAQHVPDLPRVTFGVSAGGQLAALAALDASLDVRACALWYPVTDLRQVPADIEAAGGAPDLGPQSREALLLGGTAASKPALAEAASPAAQVHAAAPPFLPLHGDADDLVPTRQSVRCTTRCWPWTASPCSRACLDTGTCSPACPTRGRRARRPHRVLPARAGR
jgi:acetyl esterase/lipase